MQVDGPGFAGLPLVERGDVCVRRFPGLEMSVVFDVDGVMLQGPPVAVAVFDVVSGVEEIT